MILLGYSSDMTVFFFCLRKVTDSAALLLFYKYFLSKFVKLKEKKKKHIRSKLQEVLFKFM